MPKTTYIFEDGSPPIIIERHPSGDPRARLAQAALRRKFPELLKDIDEDKIIYAPKESQQPETDPGTTGAQS